MVRKLEVTKIPRKDPVPDHPINFPPLENLHLELLENKRKLKKGLPLIPLVRIKPKPLPPITYESTQQGTSKDSKDDDMLAALGESSETKPVIKNDPVVEGLGDDTVETISPVDPLGRDVEDEPEFVDDPTADMAPDEKAIFNDMTATERTNYLGMSPEQRERYQKEVYIWKWRLLQRTYPARKDLPEYNEHSDLHMMKTSYERTLKELQLDDNIESYRTYLVFGFIAMEYASTQWLGIDLSGFTVQQTRMMYKYEKLLIELGERPYSKWGQNFPVEVRILGLILMQAGIFYLANVLSSKFGSTVSELFGGITGQPPPQASTDKPKKKRRMRGPKIKVDDIRNMKSDD